MTHRKTNTAPTERGFALLLSIITITVVLSVTLSMMNLSIKQGRLAADTRDSELAFHAASAGLECIQSQRRSQSSDFEQGNDVDITCFTVTTGRSNSSTAIGDANASKSAGDGDIYYYEYDITWGEGGAADRCSAMKFFVMDNTGETSPLKLSDINLDILGYPGTGAKTCEAGGVCTVFASSGYSAPCSGTYPLGTVQRDIFVEF